jgi:hypothetical protein
MPDTTRPRPAAVWALIVILLLLALGALAGGGAFILAPDGRILQMPASRLEGSIFPNYLAPGLALFLFMGVYPLLVAYSLWRRPAWGWPNVINPFKQYHWSWAGSLAAAVMLIIWLLIELLVIPFGVVHAVYFAWGALILVLTLLPSVRRYCALKPR